MRAAVVGAGLVGSRVAQLLAAEATVTSVTVVSAHPPDNAPEPRLAALRSNDRIRVLRPTRSEKVTADVVVIASSRDVPRGARAALEAGSHLVCPVDDPPDVRFLADMDRAARDRGVTIAAGTAMAPGLSCVLAAYLRTRFERVDEVHVASMGTGGPACARRHHAALTGVAVDWVEGSWRRRPGGSGRELVWFPEPVGGADCYRASLADALLLRPAFPNARRITSRMEATRRDRLTSWLPMMRKPHPEGLVGAVRVEARGIARGMADTQIVGASVAPAAAAAAVTATAALWAGAGRLTRAGSGGLAELVDEPAEFLRELVGRGVPISVFEGQPATA